MTISVSDIKGHGGFIMPAVGLGTFQGAYGVDFDNAREKMKYAIDIGYRSFDTAPLYKTEECLGTAIKAKIDAGKVDREDLFVSTKVWCTQMKYDDVLEAAKASVKNLGLDYIDLYLIHWPFAFEKGHSEPIPTGPDGRALLDESVDYLDTWRAMEECKKLGLVKNIGVSNFNMQQIERLWNNCGIKPVCNQFECNVYFQNDELVKFCQSKGIVCVAYSPICKGSDGSGNKAIMNLENAKNNNVIEDPVIRDIAKKYGKTNSQIALKFLIQRHIVVIPKSNNETRLMQNLDVCDFIISEQDMTTLRGLDKNARILTFALVDHSKYYPF